MATSRRDLRGGRVFAAPLFGIVLLLLFYWLLADWQQVSAIMGAAVATIQWPT